MIRDALTFLALLLSWSLVPALAQSPEFKEPSKNPKIAIAIDPYGANDIDWEPDNLFSGRIYYAPSALGNLLRLRLGALPQGFCIARLWRFVQDHFGLAVNVDCP